MPKIMITVPEGFLQEMDRLAQREHRNRSELIREAVRQYMARSKEKGEQRREAVLRALKVQEQARLATRNRSFDSTKFIRDWRDGTSRPNP